MFPQPLTSDRLLKGKAIAVARQASASDGAGRHNAFGLLRRSCYEGHGNCQQCGAGCNGCLACSAPVGAFLVGAWCAVCAVASLLDPISVAAVAVGTSAADATAILAGTTGGEPERLHRPVRKRRSVNKKDVCGVDRRLRLGRHIARHSLALCWFIECQLLQSCLRRLSYVRQCFGAAKGQDQAKTTSIAAAISTASPFVVDSQSSPQFSRSTSRLRSAQARSNLAQTSDS